jgi:NAD(P)-dependent dehydrogenase (short-subunit alcohol dehydrogenase family)
MATLDSTPVPDFAAQLRLAGRGFVVLGAGNGIGRQVSHALAQAGAKVACVDRDPDLAKYVANEIGGHPLTGDITKRDQVARLFGEAREPIGADKLKSLSQGAHIVSKQLWN